LQRKRESKLRKERSEKREERNKLLRKRDSDHLLERTNQKLIESLNNRSQELQDKTKMLKHHLLRKRESRLQSESHNKKLLMLHMLDQTVIKLDQSKRPQDQSLNLSEEEERKSLLRTS
jgi:hypothetical protein